MAKIYIQALVIGAAMLTVTLSFGQIKPSPAPSSSYSLNKKNQQDSSIHVITPHRNSRSVTRSKFKPKIERVKGSVHANFKNKGLKKEEVVGDFNSFFDLSNQHSFKKISEKTDKEGVERSNFQQLYKGYPVEGNILLVHSKQGALNSLNGHIAELENIEISVNVSKEIAKALSKTDLKITKTINDYPVETVITKVPGKTGGELKLAHKVRIESYNPFTMCYVYIDTKTGGILNKVNLVAHADVIGSGQTLYSGNQAITVDSYSGSFRLRESGRNIETYNATEATNLTSNGFIGSTDFTNSTKAFPGIQRLSSFTISVIAQNWWYTVAADELPDLYIKVKDKSNQVVYTSEYLDNTNTTVTFSDLKIDLIDPPYSVEVWDHDDVGDDDFGGTYPIVASIGTKSWSGSGNSGSYLIATFGNPALDAHWGMEKTHDFYLNTFNRNSYDGNGSTIKQYINSPLTQASQDGDPNNAFALGSPYNIMVYGLGDGKYLNPVVGLDVAGHEFTHLVVDNNGNDGLVYEGESGALNESFADIFGTCVEFYSGINPDWLIGEDVMVDEPFIRSMSNPNDSQNPDTYNGDFWINPNDIFDDGGVHINSGVQNFWFYLLSEGGTGINDLGNAYTVAGIGIEKARKIAYTNLITYLTPYATFQDAYNGSLQAAEDLYGNPSTQYTAVKQAWYAVGVSEELNTNYCAGTTVLIKPNGSITDGSGADTNYRNSSNCKWVIAPAGATQISLSFTEFDTEEDFDFVYVYDGPDEASPLLATWSGNELPPTITTSSGNGIMCIKFTSDNIIPRGGWSANFTSGTTTSTCSGETVLQNSTGLFTDGSGVDNYGNDKACSWVITPSCATSITLSFSQFDTEYNYDVVKIYDDLSGSNELARFSGANIPSQVTSTTGKMLVVFNSDFSNTGQGFSASYTSIGTPLCSGITNINTADSGIISDGSGSDNYCNNSNCQWLIQPPQATTVTLNFTQFDVEAADGLTIYDAVEVYDGATLDATLLGRFTGNDLPPALTSTGGSLLIRFFSNVEENRQGWSANYTSTQNSYCSATTNLTAPSGEFSDGSTTNQYVNNSNCSWLINPNDANAITLSFTSFKTEPDYDQVIIYDGVDNTALILGRFSGTAIPSSITSTGGSMYVEFLANASIKGDGWAASYTSTIIAGIRQDLIEQKLKIFPNPADRIFTINSGFENLMTLQIMDVLGRNVLKVYYINKGDNEIDASELTKGIYLIKVRVRDGYYTEKLIIY